MAATYQEWMNHYGYEDSDEARADYERYLDEAALVVSLFQEDQEEQDDREVGR